VALILNDLDTKARASVAHYWNTLESQGQPLDGFAAMARDVVIDNGLDDRFIVTTGRLSLPGFFRPTQRWDMLVLRGGLLVAALAFKALRGPSLDDDLRDCTEEALGSALDFWASYRSNAFGHGAPRPWLGWLLLVEDCPGATNPVAPEATHFEVAPAFAGTSSLAQCALLLRRLRQEGLYDGLALVTATAHTGPYGDHQQPAADLTLRRMLASLAGHVAVLQANAVHTPGRV